MKAAELRGIRWQTHQDTRSDMVSGSDEDESTMDLTQDQPKEALRQTSSQNCGTNERTILTWNFESYGQFRLSVTGDIDTKRVLDMAELLLKIKRQEIIEETKNKDESRDSKSQYDDDSTSDE